MPAAAVRCRPEGPPGVRLGLNTSWSEGEILSDAKLTTGTAAERALIERAQAVRPEAHLAVPEDREQ